MPWKSTHPETVALLESALCHLPCEKKKMFGCPVYFAGGSLFAGVHEDRVFLRLSVADREEFLAVHPDALPFEPLPGRRMREYLVLPPLLLQNEGVLQEWLSRAHGYAASLPPKASGSRGGRGRS